MRKSLANHEVVTIAVYQLGGDVQAIDTEDAAVKANELAPGRFTWRKYPDQINIEHVRAFLSDAKKKKNGGYMAGSGSDGWRLTTAGVEFARKHADSASAQSSAGERLTAQQQRWRKRERERMLASKAYEAFASGGVDGLSQRECEAFFKIDDYVGESSREQIVTRALAAFGDDPDLGAAVGALAARIRGEPNGKA
jgi:hypothetical protein